MKGWRQVWSSFNQSTRQNVIYTTQKKQQNKTKQKQKTKKTKKPTTTKPSINKIKCAMVWYEFFLNSNSIAAAGSLPINFVWSIKSNFYLLITCVLSCSTFKSNFLFTLPVVFDSTILKTCHATYLDRMSPVSIVPFFVKRVSLYICN